MTHRSAQRGLFSLTNWIALILLLAAGPPAQADPSDCVGDSADGRAMCSKPIGGEWKYGLCDGYAPYQYIDSYWCQAAGGTWQGYWVPNEGPCKGATLGGDEGSLVTVSNNFMKLFRGPEAALSSDTGWSGQLSGYGLCPVGGRVYEIGILKEDGRLLNYTFPGGERAIFAQKIREVICPAGTQMRINGSGEMRCVHPIPCDPCDKRGHPILPSTGHKILTENDGTFEGRTLSRYYAARGALRHAGAPATNDTSDPRWSMFFDYRLDPIAGNPHVIAAVSMPNGTLQYFRANGSAVFPNDLRALKLTVVNGGYQLVMGDDLLEFSSTGLLTRMTDRTGKSLALSYSDGTLGPNGAAAKGPNGENPSSPATAPVPANHVLKATSWTGRALSFTRDVSGDLTQMQVPGSADPVKYTYTKGKRLAEAKVKSASSSDPNSLATAYLYDERGQLLNFTQTGTGEASPYGASYTYSATGESDGKGTSTELLGGVDRFKLEYPTATQAVVTDPLGGKSTLNYSVIQGVTVRTSETQPAGSGSAVSTRSQAYDTNGNLLSRDDFNGTRTCFARDATRGLESTRVEGLASGTVCSTVITANATLPAGSRKISTLWHPDWKLQVRSAQPGLITTEVYNGQPDPTNGNAVASCAPTSALLPNGKPIVVLCKKVEQVTTDTTGRLGFGATATAGVAPRQTTWTYNARGQVLTEDGPRTDVADVTTYAYYADTTSEHTIGDLKSITNARGQVTQFTLYDRAGRLMRQVAPDGLVTETTYTPRGQTSTIKQKAASGQTKLTTLTYDARERLAKTLMPDGRSLTYTYDAANRLTGIADELGNTVTYTLDAAGNRVAEKYKDANGTLTRTLARLYDALNRLQSVTGASQ